MPVREEWDVFDASDLESWDDATIEEEEEVNILLKYVCCVMWRLHIQIQTLFAVFASFRRMYTLFKLIYNL